MKKILVIFLALFLLNFISAINLNIEKAGSNEAMIQGINQPAVFHLNITNRGAGDNLQFYNLLGFSMAPKGTVAINQGESKMVDLMIYPRDGFKYEGFYTIQYFIRGQDGSELPEEATIKILKLEDSVEIGSGEVSPESNSLQIYAYNKENFNFQNIDIHFSSAFFDFEKNFSLSPHGKKTFDVQLDKESFKKLMAGFYTLNADVKVDGERAKIEGVIKFAEKDILTTTKKNFGLFINTQTIQKKNEGNTVASSETVVKKNILSRLFTTVSPEPDIVERSGLAVYYTWSKKLNPGESMDISVKTNWFLPFFVILFIVAIVILAKQYVRTDLTMNKKVSFVQAKGGEFALKVSVFVHANRFVEKVNIIDMLPPLVRIYEKFPSTDRPKRINEKARRIEWDFDSLQPGETRILSYIIYSKIGVMGRFALPSATAVYQRDGDVKETNSNKAFFMTEPRQKDPVYRD